MRRIVIDALARVPDVAAGKGCRLAGPRARQRHPPEVRVIVKLMDGDDRWQGSNVVEQMMGGEHQEVAANLQEKAVWISIENAPTAKAQSFADASQHRKHSGRRPDQRRRVGSRLSPPPASATLGVRG